MSFCSGGTTATNNGQQSNQNAWANPLGASSIGPNGKPIFQASGAPQAGAQALNYLQNNMPAMNAAGQASASALQSAAANPGFGAAQTAAAGTAAGDYLSGSPELNRALAQNQAQAGAAAGNAAAQERSLLAKNGMAFGTGQQQVQQAATAQGNEAAANTNAQAYLQNYQAERGAQNNAGGQLAQAYAAPLSYLGAVPGALNSGAAAATPTISGLGSGGSIYSQGGATQGYDAGITDPSGGSDVLNTIGSL
jgi:hypothetical protein